MEGLILDDGRRPSRWNKCRFQCVICNKLSSEKRHIREHIIKVGSAFFQLFLKIARCYS
jgi:hypothetical protein